MENIGIFKTQFYWKVYSPHNHPSNSRYPKVDHTLKTSDGNYLLLDNNQFVLDKAVTMSERIFANSVACLRFYHYLNHSLLMANYSKLEIYKS